MKKRILLATVLSAVFMLGAVMNVSAADSKVITFKGEAEKFVTGISGTGQNGFANLQPDEERTLNLTLANDSSEEMKFYMSAEILDNIAAKGGNNTEAVYDFSIARGATTFFDAVIGNEARISAGQEYLTEDNNILIDTLKKGETSNVAISLKLDGDSTGNMYMNQEGEIQLNFSVETAEVTPQTIVQKATKYLQGAGKTVVKTVKTGDPASVGILIAVAASLITIIVILAKKRKGRDQMEERQ